MLVVTQVCTTVLVLCTLAGAAALTVSWLLATGNIDPGRRPEYKAGLVTSDRSKVPRRIDVAFPAQYPDIVSGKEINRIRGDTKEEEESTEKIPDNDVESESVINTDLEMSDGDNDDMEDIEGALEMESFELSDETPDFSEAQETTIEPSEEDLEMTTIVN